MQFKRFVSAFLAGVCAVGLCACDSDDKPKPPTENPYYATQEQIADLFNEGVDKLSEAESYRMVGSIASVAEVQSSAELTTSVTPIDGIVEGNRFYIDAFESNINPHRTYFDGELYYNHVDIRGSEVKYFTNGNDNADFTATEYLMKANAEIIVNPRLETLEDGSRSLNFAVPFAVYESPALIEVLGVIVDDSVRANLLSLNVVLDANGYIKQVMISFVNDVELIEEQIHQEIVLTFELSEYGTARISVPTDLDTYQNWIEELPPETTAPMVEIPPEDLG